MTVLNSLYWRPCAFEDTVMTVINFHWRPCASELEMEDKGPCQTHCVQKKCFNYMLPKEETQTHTFSLLLTAQYTVTGVNKKLQKQYSPNCAKSIQQYHNLIYSHSQMHRDLFLSRLCRHFRTRTVHCFQSYLFLPFSFKASIVKMH